MPTPEAAARKNIDAALQSAGWHVQDFTGLNLSAGLGVAVREFPLARGPGKADYALYVAGKLAGVVEAKKEGPLLTGLEVQSEKYARIMDDLRAALEQFEAIQTDLSRRARSDGSSA